MRFSFFTENNDQLGGFEAVENRIGHELTALLSSDVLQGTMWLRRLSPDFVFVYARCWSPQTLRIECTLPEPFVKFNFCLSEGTNWASILGSDVRQSAGKDSLYLIPPHCGISFEQAAFNSHHAACILVDPGKLESFFEEYKGGPPVWLRKMLFANRAERHMRIRKSTPEIKRILPLLENSAFNGPIHNMLLEAKSLEVLGATIARICRETSLEKRPNRPSGRDRKRMQHAKDLLDAEFRAPPTISLLASRLGISPVKLKTDFKTVFETSVHAYVMDRRLEAAERLLASGAGGVKQAAFEAGYRSLSHFAQIFARRFGRNPGEYLRDADEAE